VSAGVPSPTITDNDRPIGLRVMYVDLLNDGLSLKPTLLKFKNNH